MSYSIESKCGACGKREECTDHVRVQEAVDKIHENCCNEGGHLGFGSISIDCGGAAGVFSQFRRTGLSEMRPYVPGEDLTGVSISGEDTPALGGMIARNPRNYADQWYVAEKYFAENLEPA